MPPHEAALFKFLKPMSPASADLNSALTDESHGMYAAAENPHRFLSATTPRLFHRPPGKQKLRVVSTRFKGHSKS